MAREEGQGPPLTRHDIVLSWEARRGSSTALVGLGRAEEALAEAAEAKDLAEQVAGCARFQRLRPRGG